MLQLHCTAQLYYVVVNVCDENLIFFLHTTLLSGSPLSLAEPLDLGVSLKKFVVCIIAPSFCTCYYDYNVSEGEREERGRVEEWVGGAWGEGRKRGRSLIHYVAHGVHIHAQ